MNILLTYATYSSGTKLASECIVRALEEVGNKVDMKEIGTINPENFNQYDLILMGSPSWYNREKEGMPHEDFIKFSERSQGKDFTGKKFAIFGLGDKSYAHFCGAVDFLEEFVNNIKGTLAGQSLRVDSFFNDEPGKEKILGDWAKSLAAAAK